VQLLHLRPLQEPATVDPGCLCLCTLERWLPLRLAGKSHTDGRDAFVGPSPQKSLIFSTLVTYHSTGYPDNYPGELGIIPCFILPASFCGRSPSGEWLSECDDAWTLAFCKRPPVLTCLSWGYARQTMD
jgi:hypothetical protein